MNLGNLISNLETLVKELDGQRQYLTQTEVAKGNYNIIEKINQYRQLIECQIISTLSLSSFKYLKESISSEILKANESINNHKNHITHNSMESTKNTFGTKTTSFMSPEPSRYMHPTHSQPSYLQTSKPEKTKDLTPKKQHKRIQDSASGKKERKCVPPKTDCKSMLSQYKILNPNEVSSVIFKLI